MGESLLERVASGQQDAAEEVLRRFSGPVWSLARRFCGDSHEAEDAVQEIFLDVWKSAGRYDPKIGSETTFVTMIARRRLIDRRRRVLSRPKPHALPEPEIVPDREAESSVEIADDSRKVRETMDRLKPEQRQVLELALVEGQTHQQIATTTGWPLGTVKSHARRGLMRVRKLLGESAEDEQ